MSKVRTTYFISERVAIALLAAVFGTKSVIQSDDVKTILANQEYFKELQERSHPEAAEEEKKGFFTFHWLKFWD